MTAISTIRPDTRGRDRVLYTFLLLVAVLMYVDPTYTGFGAYRVNRDAGPIKYAIALLALSSVFIDTYVLMLRGPARGRQFSRGLLAGWAVYAFAIMAAAGSIYGRVADNVTDNFLQLSIGSMLGFTSALLSILVAEDPDRLLRRFFLLLGIAMLYVVPTIVWKRIQGGQAFHTEIFLVIPALGYAIMVSRHAALKMFLSALMLGVALSLHKNIGYITLAITGYVVLWMLEAEAPVGRPGRLRISKKLVFAMIVGLGAAVVIAARLEGAEPKFVPSGSVEVRSYVYRVLLHRFLDNPLIGDFYSSSALVELPYMEVLGNHHVTAHSDWLDALAHGGVIGGLLLFAATAWQLRHGPRPSLRRPLAFNRQARDFVEPSIGRQRLIAGLWLIAACGTVVSAFVSMLSALPIAFLFWSSIGFYVGIRLRD